LGTLYYNKAQWEEYKALELVEKATIREAKQIKEAAQEQLKKKLTAEGVPFGSAHFMDEDDPRRAEMLALEEKIEDDAEKMIKEAEEAAFFFRVQMKRDTETQDKLKKNFLDKRKEKERKEKAGATIQPSSGLIPTAESPTVADEDSILEAVANKKEAKIKKIRLLVAGPGNAADPTVADEDSAVTTNGVPPTGAPGSGNTNARGSGAYIFTINNVGTKNRRVELDPNKKDDWDEEELRGYLRNLQGAQQRWNEGTERILKKRPGLKGSVWSGKRTKKSEAFAKEIEELEQLRKSKGWSPPKTTSVVTGVEMGDRPRGPSVNVSGSGTEPTGETNKTAWSDRDEFQYENYKDILPKLATYLSGRLPGEPKDGSRKKWRGMYYDHPEFKKRFEELGGSTSGSPGIYKRKWSNVTFQHSKDFENLYNERRGLPLAKTELNPEGLNIYPKGLLEKLAKEEQKSRADPSGGAPPTMMEVDDVLEEALTKAELKLKATDVGTPEYADAMNKVARLEQDIKKLEWMSSEEFNELTPNSKIMESFYNAPRPDPEKQDEVAIAMLTPGSIHVHDMKAESAIKNLMLTPIETTPPPVEANFDQIPATVLEQAIVTATMQAATTNQAVAQGGGSRMVNAPTSIDNSRHQTLTPPSSAHSPGVPPGSGHMGVSTPRG
jgi:hypothetical protein